LAFFDVFRSKKKPAAARPQERGRGLLIFESTSEVIQAEKLLQGEGWEIKVVGPPPEIQKGCDLAIEFPLVERLRIVRILSERGLPPLDVSPVNGPLLQPVDLFQIKDFGEHLMVRAANMKITVDKRTRIIVNVSGGGCPDVPYLAAQMTGKRLSEAPRPRDLGHTLCGYALELAFQEMERQCSSS
jgi:hypothetical protein